MYNQQLANSLCGAMSTTSIDLYDELKTQISAFALPQYTCSVHHTVISLSISHSHNRTAHTKRFIHMARINSASDVTKVPIVNEPTNQREVEWKIF